MIDANASPDDRYDALVATLLDDDRVAFDASGKGFGASALKTGGKIFAMLVAGQLVIKLPRQRVDALIAARAGTRFDPGHGRLMKEWASIPASSWVSRRRTCR